MGAEAIATRMSVLTRALPTRVLLVDDDARELESIADRLTNAGFEVTRAADGAEALRLLDRVWYPIVLTDSEMPAMDGVALAESIRARGIDTFIILLTTREAGADYARGQAAGIDDYVAKEAADAELFARINAGFNTLALRRSLKEAQEALDKSVSVDVESGAFSPRETLARLQSEIRRAERYGRPLTVITVGLRAQDRTLAVEHVREIVQALGRVIRAHVDWIGRLQSDSEAVFGIVLPEANITDGPAIKERLANTAARFLQSHPGITATFGLTALTRGVSAGEGVEPAQMIQVAERCRSCNGRVGTEQLEAVRQSITGHVAIACRHGYAVGSDCPLQSRERARA